MSSTAVEFGLINIFRTENLLVDTLMCMLVPLLIQKVVTYVRESPTSLLVMLRNLLFPEKSERRVSRVIETKQRFNRWGKVWDDEQKNELLQKAISIYLADVLDLKSKNADYELLENTKESNDSSASSTGSETDDSDDEDSDYCGEVVRLNVEALPPRNEWITVEPGVQFKHEVICPEGPTEKSTVQEKTVNFRFESSLPDASKRIDAIIDRAFRNYQEVERRQHVEDKSRYFYIQADMPVSTSSEDKSKTPVVAYKRYALGEEKTFDNLFFHEKDQVVQLLDNFTNKAGKFAIKGFPYKLGLLLHGPPGTGKTSLIKAVAQHTRRHIVTISLGKIQTNQQLLDTIFDMKFAVQGLDSPIEMSFEDVVFVMEDIDCASSIVNAREDDSKSLSTKTAASGIGGAETSEKPNEEVSADSVEDKLVSTMIKACLDDEKKYNQRNDKLNLSGLLNVLDGVIDCPGRMVIMTTNHPEKLDPALVRPGRVNKKLLLGYMGCPHIQQMIEYYCVSKFDRTQEERLRIAFEASTQTLTPAVVEEICAEFDDVDAVLGGFERLVATHSA